VNWLTFMKAKMTHATRAPHAPLRCRPIFRIIIAAAYRRAALIRAIKALETGEQSTKSSQRSGLVN
jgi:hypothetical protein